MKPIRKCQPKIYMSHDTKTKMYKLAVNEQALAKLWNLLFFRPVLLQVKGTEFY